MSCVKCYSNKDLEDYTHARVRGYGIPGVHRIKIKTWTRTFTGKVCPDCRKEFKIYKKIEIRAIISFILWICILSIGLLMVYFRQYFPFEFGNIMLGTFLNLVSIMVGVLSLVIYEVNKLFSKKNPDKYFK